MKSIKSMITWLVIDKKKTVTMEKLHVEHDWLTAGNSVIEIRPVVREM
jgi:hypothetical protein